MANLSPDILQQMIDAGLVDDQASLLAQAMARGQGLMATPGAQGMNVGGTYRASSPLEHAATALARVMGGRQVRDAEAGLRGLVDQKRVGRMAFAQNPSPVLGALSGDPAMGAAGQAQATEAQRATAAAHQQHTLEQQIAEQQANAARYERAQAETERRNRVTEATERTRLEQDAWGAVADPVTGGIVMFNKKTGETKPLGPGGGTPPAPASAGGPLPGLPGKPTEGQRKAVLSASESISQLDMAIDALKKAPGAYGGVGNFMAGLAETAGGTPVQSLTARRYNPEELRVKNYVSNVVSKIINERAGANVTLREELRQKFLPQDTDGLEQAQQKLGDLRAMMAATYQAQGNGMVPDAGAPASAPPAPVRRFTRDASGNLVEVKP